MAGFLVPKSACLTTAQVGERPWSLAEACGASWLSRGSLRMLAVCRGPNGMRFFAIATVGVFALERAERKACACPPALWWPA